MAMRIGDRHKLSPSSAGAMFSLPAPLQTTTTAAQHRQMASYAEHGLVRLPSQVERHHFLLRFLRFDIALLCSFSTFRLDHPTAVAHSSPSTYSFRFGPPVAASHIRSNPPVPLFTSSYHHRRCRRILGCFVYTITCPM